MIICNMYTVSLEVIFNVMRSINPRFTYLLAYLNEQLDRERRYIFTRKAGIDR